MITARYPHNTGAPELHTDLPKGLDTFPKLLKEAGYYTALSAFKLAVMLEGVYQRSLADPTRGDTGGMGDMVLTIAGEAEAAISS